MTVQNLYRGADKSLARPTSRRILFVGENISCDASLVLYVCMYVFIYIYIYRAKDLSPPLYQSKQECI
jgi:hypothetical protein